MDKLQRQLIILRKRYIEIPKAKYVEYARAYKRLARKDELRQAWEHFKKAIKLLIR